MKELQEYLDSTVRGVFEAATVWMSSEVVMSSSYMNQAEVLVRGSWLEPEPASE